VAKELFAMSTAELEAARSANGSVADDGDRRRLAAVAFADVVGYSMLMTRDEPGTHNRWMRMLAEIVRPAVARHRGRVVKSTGDGVLTEFQSAADAVLWAQQVQRAVRAQGSRDAEGRPLALRISVHLGDVIESEDDIYGDGVNVAARLQEYAPAGGVVLSSAVYDLVRAHLDVQTRDLGQLALKNFDRPVSAFALDIETEAPCAPPPAPRRIGPLPSIAVLPLRNVSGNPEDNYFADGIVEDIIVSLANLQELVVIARASTLRYSHQEPDPREIGRALGVRYVLTGTVRRSARLVRVTVQLWDADTGANLWAHATEVPPKEIFEAQDGIVLKIVGGIAPHVRVAELQSALRKRPGSFTAYDHTLRALDMISSLDKPTFMLARTHLERAMAIDPQFAAPFAWTARWHSLLFGQGWSSDPDEDCKTAIRFAARAIELDRQNALALAIYGHLKAFLFHDCETALLYFERALAASPSSSLAWNLSAATLTYVGRCEEAVRHAERGLRLSPFDPTLFR
jgi:adenylate cyclase